MIGLPQIRGALKEKTPEEMPPEGRNQAAVAMVFREEPEATEVLFIERASHPGDPWSGHMAFPGGRVDPVDASLRAAAERETREEVGVELRAAEYLGRLDDIEGYRGGRKVGLVISAFAYYHPEPEDLIPSYEVAEALWVPVSRLWDPTRRVDHHYQGAGPYPGIQVSEAAAHVVWGLTYRFVQNFLDTVGVDRAGGVGPHP